MSNIRTAIAEVQQHYHDFDAGSLSFYESDKTYLDNNTLYYKNIPQALLLLNSQRHIDKLDTSFDNVGILLDLSRNSVFKVDYLKSLIIKYALMGANQLFLYLEDTFTIDDEVYFGYMRGKYSDHELSEIVRYASLLGVEVIPCIQTLSHHEQFLRWNSVAKQYKDTRRVLLTESDDTEHFIDKMLKKLKQVFRTNKIHIGLDEAEGLGTLGYLKRNGYKDRKDIFLNHLNKVYSLCQSNGFNDIAIWSDMLFAIYGTGEYYDYNFVAPEIDLPEGLTLYYWDYYHEDASFYHGMLNKHLEFSSNIKAASGIWTWRRFVYDHQKTLNTALHYIEACKANTIRNVMFTMWNDDGAFCDFETSSLGVFSVLSQSLTRGKLPSDLFNSTFRQHYDSLLSISEINQLGIENIFAIWDDPIMGIQLNNKHAENSDVFDEFLVNANKLKNRLLTLEQSNSTMHAIHLIEVMIDKISIRKELMEKYPQKEELSHLVDSVHQALINLDNLKTSMRNNWMERNKPYGFDVLQARFGFLTERYKELLLRLDTYNTDKNSAVFPELTEDIPPYESEYITALTFNDMVFSSVGTLA